MGNVENILERVSRLLQDAPGVVGVVLGGSRARNTHRASSDIDIGIYYDGLADFDVKKISKVAAQLDDMHRENLITPLGGWGDWVNGGGWLIVEGFHVDFLFRDIARVSQVINQCLAGNIAAHYHAGHPHAYLNVMYMGEISICRILSDPTGRIAELKAETRPYPRSVKHSLIKYFMFEASFSLMFAQDNADKDDVSYLAGHCYRIISCLNQVLFAINEEYCINEKRAVAMVEKFKSKPPDYKHRVDRVISLLSPDFARAQEGISILAALVAETKELASS